MPALSIEKVRRALRSPRSRIFALAAALLALTGCHTFSDGGTPTVDNSAAPTPQADATPAPDSLGDAFGGGPVRVGMIVPLTQNGMPSVIGTALRNAAQLAVDESASKDITVIVQDDRSTSDGAALAAHAEIDAGAKMLVGPLFASSVRAVGPIASAAGRPVIAFSTDTTVASKGVYLLSFLIESYVDRAMEFAASKGKTSIAVLAPQNDYAKVAVTEAQIEAGKLHMNLVTVATYAPGQPASGVQQIAGLTPPVDAVLIPEQPDGMATVAAALAATPLKAQLLGTGVWNDPKVYKLPGLQGAWFSTPENAGFDSFAGRYRARYKSDPPRLATLAYDAISLVAALAHSQGANGFTDATLTNPSGFNGADGVFRFRADGPNERGLAVMQINNGAISVISPAPKTFSGG